MFMRMVQDICFKLVYILLMGFLWNTSLSQNEVQLQTINKYLRILYISNPTIANTQKGALVSLDLSELTNGKLDNMEINKLFQKSPEVRKLVIKMLGAGDKGGDKKLQSIMASLLNISKKTITLELYADYRNEFLKNNNAYHSSYGLSQNDLEPPNSSALKKGITNTHSWV